MNFIQTDKGAVLVAGPVKSRTNPAVESFRPVPVEIYIQVVLARAQLVIDAPAELLAVPVSTGA